jgi:chromosome partitioning protein
MAVNRAHVIVVGNEKGGSGKSTAAMHLVVAYLQAGRRVASVDLDARQGTLTRYVANRRTLAKQTGAALPMPSHFAVDRRSGLPLGAPLTAEEKSRLKLLIEGASAGHDVLMIDTPGSDSELSRLGHSYADTLITPINDSFVDFDVLAHVDPQTLAIKGPSHYAEMVWEVKKMRVARDGGSIDWIVLRNRLSHLDARNKRDIERLMRELSARIGYRIVPGFGERVIFRELFLQGLTVLDLKGASGVGNSLSLSHVAARQEVRNLLDAIHLPAPQSTPVSAAAPAASP